MSERVPAVRRVPSRESDTPLPSAEWEYRIMNALNDQVWFKDW